jgi:hypothetical protein
MAEGITTPDGRPLDLDREFAAAMAAPEPDEPMAPAPPRVDPEAPFGYKADGTPRQRPAGPGRGRKSPQNTNKATPTSQPKPTTESPEKAAQRRTEGVQGLMQIGAGLALAVGKAKKNDAFKADAFVLASNAEPLAEACASVAADNVPFANALDKVTQVGPYGALMAVAIPMLTQLVRNHKPSTNLPGTKDPKELAAALESASAGNDAPAE